MRGAFPIIAIGLFLLAALPACAAMTADIVAKIKTMKPQERINFLLKGAQAEGELVYYGTLPIDEFLPLARIFNGRYRSIALQHYFAPRDGILSRTLTEARAATRRTLFKWI
jgi:hypothetical protein